MVSLTSTKDILVLTADASFKASDKTSGTGLLFKNVRCRRRGKRIKKSRYYYPEEKPCRMIYMEDTFGNILEVYSHSYELIYNEGAY